MVTKLDYSLPAITHRADTSTPEGKYDVEAFVKQAQHIGRAYSAEVKLATSLWVVVIEHDGKRKAVRECFKIAGLQNAYAFVQSWYDPDKDDVFQEIRFQYEGIVVSLAEEWYKNPFALGLVSTAAMVGFIKGATLQLSEQAMTSVAKIALQPDNAPRIAAYILV